MGHFIPYLIHHLRMWPPSRLVPSTRGARDLERSKDEALTSTHTSIRDGCGLDLLPSSLFVQHHLGFSDRLAIGKLPHLAPTALV